MKELFRSSLIVHHSSFLRGKLIMVRDDHDRREPPSGAPGVRFRSPGWLFGGAVLALAVVSVLVVTGCFKARVPPEPEAGGDLAAAPPGLRLFNGWPKPDLALVLSGQMYGYLQPCGCSRPQLGG